MRGRSGKASDCFLKCSRKRGVSKFYSKSLTSLPATFKSFAMPTFLWGREASQPIEHVAASAYCGLKPHLGGTPAAPRKKPNLQLSHSTLRPSALGHRSTPPAQSNFPPVRVENSTRNPGRHCTLSALANRVETACED